MYTLLMSVRPTPFVTGEYYHIYNRGNSKQVIFHDEQDHYYFINLLGIMNNEQRSKSGITKRENPSLERVISIGVYCLMPNHFHILLKQEKEAGVTLFMQKLSTAYVMYYNKKYKRTGGLFEGKFKSKHAGDDAYLKYLFSYIHLNPLKLLDSDWKTSQKSLSTEKLQFLAGYKYSSFGEYYTNVFTLVDKAPFPGYFSNHNDFIRDISSWFTKTI